MGLISRVIRLIVVSPFLITTVVGNRIGDRDSPRNVLSVRATRFLANNLFPIPLTKDILFNFNRMFLPVDITLGIPRRNGLFPGGLFSRRG